MPTNNLNNQSRPRPDASRTSKPRPRLSLNLHTMPVTDSGHWTKWLFLGLAVLAIIAIAAYFIFTR